MHTYYLDKPIEDWDAFSTETPLKPGDLVNVEVSHFRAMDYSEYTHNHIRVTKINGKRLSYEPYQLPRLIRAKAHVQGAEELLYGKSSRR